MNRPALGAVIKDEVTAAGGADDDLLKFAVGVFAAGDVACCAPDVINPFDVKGKVLAFFKGYQAAVVVAVYGKFNQPVIHFVSSIL